MISRRTNSAKKVISALEESYGEKIRIFSETIPISGIASDSTSEGVSIFTYEPSSKVAKAYAALVKEVLADVA
jgi:chromosome partitioning protein